MWVALFLVEGESKQCTTFCVIELLIDEVVSESTSSMCLCNIIRAHYTWVCCGLRELYSWQETGTKATLLILAAPIRLQNVAPPSRLWSHLMRPDLPTIIVRVCRLWPERTWAQDGSSLVSISDAQFGTHCWTSHWGTGNKTSGYCDSFIVDMFASCWDFLHTVK